MGMATTLIDHIETTPGVCGGRPRIAGHRIRIQDIVVWHERQGFTPAEIVSHHPGITLADVHAALAYYHDHRDDIRQHMEADAARVDAARQQVPSKLAQKLSGGHGLSELLSPDEMKGHIEFI